VELDPAAVGAQTETLVHRYGWRELALYALGVGAEVERDLALVYEGRGPTVLPSYAVVPALAAVRALLPQVGGSPRGHLHASQRVLLHRPLPAHGALRTRGRLVGLHDMRRFAQSTIATRSEDESGALVAETEWVVFHTADTVRGGEPPPRRRAVRPPSRAADFSICFPISANQAALYRLNGDDNPLHIDAAIAGEAGYPRPILHGLCVYGMACLAMLRAGVAPTRIRSMEGQFRAPVFPGDVLVVALWREGGQMLLRAHAEQRPDEPALAYGYAEFFDG
jgi:acyl dehydratase